MDFGAFYNALRHHALHVGINYACTTSTAFTLAPCWHQIRMHHIHSLPFCSYACAFKICWANQPSLHPPFFCPLTLTQPPTSFIIVYSCWLFFILGFVFSSLDVHCRNKMIGVCGMTGLKRPRTSPLMLVR